jgi:ethanolaminephosphotransferase
MFFSTWETYHTHTLYLGYFNGPTEGLILACTIMILSGIYGPEIWSTPLIKLLPSYEEYLGLITFRDLWVPIILFTFFVAHLPACIVNVARARRAQNLPLAPLFWEWTPLFVFVISTTAWLGSPYSFILKDNHLVLYCLTMSLVFGRMTTKIILAHLTRQSFPYWTVMLVPMIGGALLVNHPYFTLSGTTIGPVSANFELWYLRGYFVFAAIVYGRWAHLVITSICNFLGINCLTIPSKPKSEKGANSNGVANGTHSGKGRRD